MAILVEQHVIHDRDPHFEKIDSVAFAARNRYNLGNTTIRQSWLFGGGYIPFAQRYHLLKGAAAYRALPRKVSQQVFMQLDQHARHRLAPATPNGCGT
jgi:putative transposase